MSQAVPESGDPMHAVDLARYPIDDPDGAGSDLVARCRREIGATGACALEGFLTPAATARLAAASAAAAQLAHHHEGRSTPYLEIPDEGFGDGHPRTRWDSYSLSAIAYDHVPAELTALYRWDPLMELARRALCLPELHRYADPLGACSVNVFADGDHQNWHFDQTDFVVSIALQTSTQGGDFLYVPKIRGEDDERYDQVSRVLDGDERGAVRIEMRPGTLLLFQGRTSIHRVSRVSGPRPRLVALLSYDTKPGTCASPLLQQARYGRVARPPDEAPPARDARARSRVTPSRARASSRRPSR